jgi:hypothetical protein
MDTECRISRRWTEERKGTPLIVLDRHTKGDFPMATFISTVQFTHQGMEDIQSIGGTA